MIKTLLAQVKEFKKASFLTPVFMILEVVVETIVKFPTKSENNLKYVLQTVKNHPSRLLFSQNILNLSQNKSKVFQAS